MNTMFFRWLIPILVLPGTALVFVPAAIVWFSSTTTAVVEVAKPTSALFWFGLVLLIPGLLLGSSTMTLFIRFGEGTAAPWDPPQKLVIRGPYRYVRNPMISGVLFLLAAEALLLQSWPLAVWCGVFFFANSIYFPKIEEPGLKERFGDDYTVYCQHVGRWLPRLSPWKPEGRR